MARDVVVEAPATIANLGPGFDTIGLALEAPFDRVAIQFGGETHRVIVEPAGLGIPDDPGANVAVIAARAVCRAVEREMPAFRMTVTKGTPPGSGLGSSGASAAAGAFAMAKALDVADAIGPDGLLAAAAEGERAASGAAHLDNVGPALFGGFVIVGGPTAHGGPGPMCVRMPFPEAWFAVILPAIEVSTRMARSILPPKIDFEDAVVQLGWIARVVAGAATRDLALVASGMDDRLATPARRSLIPHFEKAREAALDAGGLAFGISGSGPAMFALCRTKAIAEVVANATRSVFEGTVGARSWVVRPGNGCRLVEP